MCSTNLTENHNLFLKIRENFHAHRRKKSKLKKFLNLFGKLNTAIYKKENIAKLGLFQECKFSLTFTSKLYNSPYVKKTTFFFVVISNAQKPIDKIQHPLIKTNLSNL
jgi:hypothetical protein